MHAQYFTGRLLASHYVKSSFALWITMAREKWDYFVFLYLVSSWSIFLFLFDHIRDLEPGSPCRHFSPSRCSRDEIRVRAVCTGVFGSLLRPTCLARLQAGAYLRAVCLTSCVLLPARSDSTPASKTNARSLTALSTLLYLWSIGLFHSLFSGTNAISRHYFFSSMESKAPTKQTRTTLDLSIVFFSLVGTVSHYNKKN